MFRTQIYLDTDQVKKIKAQTVIDGVSQSQLIREAIDAFLDLKKPGQDWKTSLRLVQGVWKDRTDINHGDIRNEFDRIES